MEDTTEFPGYYETFMDAYRPEGNHEKRPVDSGYYSRVFDIEGRVLDLCCGAGLHALTLAEDGLDVVGLDIQSRMLEEASQHVTDAGQDIALVQGDATRLGFAPDSFDWVVMLGNSLPLFDVEAFSSVAADVATVLKPGGCFGIAYMDLVGTALMDQYRRVLPEQSSGAHVFSFHKNFDADSGTVTRVFYDFDRGTAFELDLHVWAPWLVQYMLADEGFERTSSRSPQDHARIETYELGAGQSGS